jgi:hypothetical protein
MKPTFDWQSTPALWMVYEDPEGISGLGKTKEDALANFVEQLDEDYRRQLDAQALKLSKEQQNLADHKAYIGGLREACDTLRAELSKTQREAEEMIERKHQMVVSYEREARERTAYAERLVTALTNNISHDPMCMSIVGGSSCSCGALDAALAAVPQLVNESNRVKDSAQVDICAAYSPGSTTTCPAGGAISSEKTCQGEGRHPSPASISEFPAFPLPFVHCFECRETERWCPTPQKCAAERDGKSPAVNSSEPKA